MKAMGGSVNPKKAAFIKSEVSFTYELAKKFTLNVKPFFLWSMVELNSKARGTQYMFTSHGDRWGWIFIFHTKL